MLLLWHPVLGTPTDDLIIERLETCSNKMAVCVNIAQHHPRKNNGSHLYGFYLQVPSTVMCGVPQQLKLPVTSGKYYSTNIVLTCNEAGFSWCGCENRNVDLSTLCCPDLSGTPKDVSSRDSRRKISASHHVFAFKIIRLRKCILAAIQDT